MNFIGIDLAWKISEEPRARTGLAAIDVSGCLLEVGLAATDDEIISFVRRYAGLSCAVGIDAPLIVKNATGQRPVENTLLKQGINSYPSNQTLFQWVFGGVRGEVLVEKLASDGFKLVIEKPREDCYFVYEVFPSPAYRTILNLDPTIRLKRRKGVNTADMQSGLRVARDRLFRGTLNPPLSSDLLLDRSFINQDPGELRGCALDQFGDMLDAILSAYIIYSYYHKPDPSAVVGDLETGYILLPSR